jgi:hypothetical protein
VCVVFLLFFQAEYTNSLFSFCLLGFPCCQHCGYESQGKGGKRMFRLGTTISYNEALKKKAWTLKRGERKDAATTMMVITDRADDRRKNDVCQRCKLKYKGRKKKVTPDARCG